MLRIEIGKKTITKTTLAIFAILTVALLTISTVVIPSAFALTRFFNCTTGIANKTGMLTLNDVNTCYDKKFPSRAGGDSSSTTASSIAANVPVVTNPSQSSVSTTHDNGNSEVHTMQPDFAFPSIPH